MPDEYWVIHKKKTDGTIINQLQVPDAEVPEDVKRLLGTGLIDAITFDMVGGLVVVWCLAID